MKMSDMDEKEKSWVEHWLSEYGDYDSFKIGDLRLGHHKGWYDGWSKGFSKGLDVIEPTH